MRHDLVGLDPDCLRRLEVVALPDVAGIDDEVAVQIKLVATRQLVLQTVAKLRARDRQVLFLRHINGCSAREVAAIVGTRPDTAQRRINRAEYRFRQHFNRLEAEGVASLDTMVEQYERAVIG